MSCEDTTGATSRPRAAANDEVFMSVEIDACKRCMIMIMMMSSAEIDNVCQ